MKIDRSDTPEQPSSRPVADPAPTNAPEAQFTSRADLRSELSGSIDHIRGIPADEYRARHYNPDTGRIKQTEDGAAYDGGGYPPHKGAELDADGKQIVFDSRIHSGQRLERAGREQESHFLTDFGMPPESLSLPASRVEAGASQAEPFYKFQYVATRDVDATVSPIREAFEHPGGGTQYHVDESVDELAKEGGSLRRLPVQDCAVHDTAGDYPKVPAFGLDENSTISSTARSAVEGGP